MQHVRIQYPTGEDVLWNTIRWKYMSSLSPPVSEHVVVHCVSYAPLSLCPCLDGPVAGAAVSCFDTALRRSAPNNQRRNTSNGDAHATAARKTVPLGGGDYERTKRAVCSKISGQY